MLWLERSKQLLAGLLVTALLSSCATVRDQVKDPEVSINDVRVVGMSLADAQLAVDLDVKNPNAFALSLKGLSYGVQIEDKALFDGMAKEKLEVAANGSSRVTLPFSVRYEDVLGTIDALRNHKELRYRISGKADFGLITMPYSKEGKFSVPKLPDISVESLQISNFSFTGVELALGLKVANLNGFPIHLDGMNYDLKLADTSLLQGQSSQPLSVNANGDGMLKLKMSVGYGQLGAILEKLRTAKSLPIEFNSQVKVPGGKQGGALPYQWKGDVPLLH